MTAQGFTYFCSPHSPRGLHLFPSLPVFPLTNFFSIVGLIHCIQTFKSFLGTKYYFLTTVFMVSHRYSFLSTILKVLAFPHLHGSQLPIHKWPSLLSVAILTISAEDQMSLKIGVQVQSQGEGLWLLSQ